MFPRAYHFPPFFTRQPVLQTHHAQLQKWASLILAYCKHHRIWKLSLVDALERDLFRNEKLGKRMSREDAKEILEFMRGEGRVEWIGRGETECWIWWRNVEEWAGLLYEWVDETGQKNTVLTVYELTESEATLSQGELFSVDSVGGWFLLILGRVPWYGWGSVAESSGGPGEARKGTGIRPGRSARCEVLLDNIKDTHISCASCTLCSTMCSWCDKSSLCDRFMKEQSYCHLTTLLSFSISTIRREIVMFIAFDYTNNARFLLLLLRYFG